MNVQKLCKLIDLKKEELFALLCELIQINSESFGYRGNEKECAEYVHKFCKKIGLESCIYSPLELKDFEKNPDYFPGRNLDERYNVTACWKGKEDINELMLMGHIDTVEIGVLENWDVDPLNGLIKDGKIYGRGACDDKYALATVMFLIKLLKDEGFMPQKNLMFTAYSDEELGGSHGAMASVIKYPCTRVVNMDGRQEQIWNCASGGQVVSYRYHTINPADSARLTAMAISIIIEEIDKFGCERKKELEKNRFYSETKIPSTSLRYMEVRSGNNGMDMDKGEIQFTYYTDKSKDNIYKEFAEIEERLNRCLAPMGIEGDGFFPITRFFHYGFCEPNCQEIKDMLESSYEAIGKTPIVCGSCLSDLSIIFKYGAPNSFAFGAGRDFSKEGGAHQHNEYIECDKLVEYVKVIGAYILKVLG